MVEKNESGLCRAIIVSDDIYTQSRLTLESLGIKVYPAFCNEKVMKPLRLHTDMQIVMIEDNIYVCAPECYEYYEKLLCNHNVRIIKGNAELSSNYPGDIAYNITVTEKYVVHNFKYTDKILESNLTDREHINVSQGYAGCSICPINNESFITSDQGIYDSLHNAGCNVLKISTGSILLPGFEYGFLGGAAFMLSDSLLAINGNLMLHPDYERIKSFCDSFKVKLLSLSEQEIMDIGSAVIIK